MNPADARWDRRLNITTGAADFEKDDRNHSRYEPTSYAVMERLAQSGHIARDNYLVDYGCGKGRVGMFLSHVTGCRSLGVEYDPEIYACAAANRGSLRSPNAARADFRCCAAEDHDVGDADMFYFFNPFSEKLLRAVLGRISEAYYAAPRPMKLFFYYATDPYLEFRMTCPEVQFAGEIDCRDLFHNPDPREKILIFTIG